MFNRVARYIYHDHPGKLHGYCSVAMTMIKSIKRFPSVASPESPNPPNLWDTMGQCNFTSRSRVRPRGSMGRVARHADKVQLYLAFTRSTTPIHGKGCAWRRHVGKKVQLYLAFARSTTPIHGKGCPSRRQGATLPRVRALDHANPWEGLRVTPKSYNCIPRVSTTPIHGKGCAWRRRVGKKVQLYLAFARSTTPSHGKGCASRRKVATIYLAFTRSTTPIHGKGCAWRRHVGKKVQLYLAFARSTTPIHGKGCPSRRQGATLPRVRALDHANPWEGLHARSMARCWLRL